MRRTQMSRLFGALVGAILLVSTPISAQQVTGGVIGVVRDAQEAVLPGVTVTLEGEALIGGAQTAVTNETGNYQLTLLPPGVYVLTYELAGFTTLRRDGIRIQVALNTRLDVEMPIGALQETITVSGSAPLVDVTSTTTQTNIDKDFFDTVPTARNPWVMAALVPGVVASTLDVGGTSGMQQYSLTAYGSSSSQRSLSVDGVKMNWSGGDGGSANQYYGNEMFEEYNLQTASGTAESDVSGVFTNQVTRSGGNRLSGEYTGLFMNSAMQSDNVDDRILGLLGAAPGTQVDAAGNPIDVMYDFSATLGGPIKRDKVWFFGSLRYFRLDQFQIGAINPDGSLAIDDNLLRVGMGKVTYQATPGARLSLLYMPHIRERFHRRNAPFLAVPDKAAIYNVLPTDSSVATWNQLLSNKAVLNVSFGRVWGDFANRYQEDVGPNDIVLSDTDKNQRFNAHTLDEVNPNSRYQAGATFSYFSQDLLAASHDFKLGFQKSLDVMDWERRRNFDMQLVMLSGVPTHALLSNTPVSAQHRWNTWAFFLQDSARFRRLTLNLGVRFDGAKAWLPAQSSPAGLWVGPRDFPRTEVYDFPFNVGPRVGAVYDLTGSGKTALKGYYGRFYDQFGANLPEAVNPNNSTTVQVPWNDRNNNFTYDPGELDLAPFVGFPAGVFPVVLPDSRRPYSEEVSAGIEHTLFNNVALSISYHRRQFRDGLVQFDRARPPSAYTPVERTYTDPYDGQLKPITVYNLDAALVTVRDRVIGNFDSGSNYNGVEITVTKRMTSWWQMLGGVTFSEHVGFDYAVPYAGGDLNDPNARVNADHGSVRDDLPWTAKWAGSFRLPYGVLLAGKYNARAGDPVHPNLYCDRSAPGHNVCEGGTARRAPNGSGDQFHRPARIEELRPDALAVRGGVGPLQHAQRQSRAGDEPESWEHLREAADHSRASNHAVQPYGTVLAAAQAHRFGGARHRNRRRARYATSIPSNSRSAN